MKLLEFITYCKLSNMIVEEIEYPAAATIDRAPLYKILVEGNDARCELLYKIIQGQGLVVKCHFYSGGESHYTYNPLVSEIVEAFFPNETA